MLRDAEENLTLREYLTQLVRMGDGLPLGKIANNDIVELNVDFELTSAQARLLAKVLRKNTSLAFSRKNTCDG